MNPAELKALRKSAGLTQGQLGHEIGVSRVFVGLMERGLATIERRTDLAVRHIIGKGRVATSRPPSRKCGMCDDTGYKDYAGFAMDPCDHSRADAPNVPEKLAGGWRPIESAPKDGTIIDVWRACGRDTVYWGLPPHTCGEMGSYCDSDWHDIKTQGWVCSTFGEFIGGAHAPFTHWMPLPDAPAPGDGA